jgi:hypothetical protein
VPAAGSIPDRQSGGIKILDGQQMIGSLSIAFPDQLDPIVFSYKDQPNCRTTF